MSKYRVGCVPFVNASPLVAWFEAPNGSDEVEVVYELPSLLPAMLDSVEVDVVLLKHRHFDDAWPDRGRRCLHRKLRLG